MTGTGTMPIGVTERPAATMIGIKMGEVAQARVSQGSSLFISLCLPYISASAIVMTALIMGYL